jgi:hypothetical protein
MASVSGPIRSNNNIIHQKNYSFINFIYLILDGRDGRDGRKIEESFNRHYNLDLQIQCLNVHTYFGVDVKGKCVKKTTKWIFCKISTKKE